MEKDKIIISQAKEIVELRDALSAAENKGDTFGKFWLAEKERREKAEKSYDRLLFEFSRALEIIRSSGIEYKSEIIEAETQKGCSVNNG